MKIIVPRCLFDVQIEWTLFRGMHLYKNADLKCNFENSKHVLKHEKLGYIFLQYSCNDAISKVLQA